MGEAAQVNTPDNYITGRPAEHDLIELANHLDQWSRDYNHWDLCKWVDEVDIDPTQPAQWARHNLTFRKAWLKAKNRIAARRTEMATIDELPITIYNKYQHNYDSMHYDFEEEHRDRDAKRQAKAKAEAEKELSTPVTNEKVEALLAQLEKLQASALSMAASKSSKAE